MHAFAFNCARARALPFALRTRIKRRLKGAVVHIATREAAVETLFRSHRDVGSKDGVSR